MGRRRSHTRVRERFVGEGAPSTPANIASSCDRIRRCGCGSRDRQGNGIPADLREVPGRPNLPPFVQQTGMNALGATMSSRLNDAATDVAEGVEAMLEMVEDVL